MNFLGQNSWIRMVVVFVVLLISFSLVLGENYPRPSDGEPLFLTPYIERNKIKLARELSCVGPLPNVPYDVPSYSGYLTVDKKYNSNTFFWFFPMLKNDVSAPIILWLQGGPGTSLFNSVFGGNGPYVLRSNTTAGLRIHTWLRDFHVLYVDHPVGTGYSFTEDERGYARTEAHIADTMYVFLQQFFQLFDEYSQNDFYIAGESYGGKHAPFIARKIHTNGPPAPQLKFKGLSIGNGFIDVHLLEDFDQYLFYLGLVDKRQAAIIKNDFVSMERHLHSGEYLEGLRDLNKIVPFLTDKDVLAINSNLSLYTGFDNFFFNFLQDNQPENYTYAMHYAVQPKVRRALHVGNLKFHDGSIVKHGLRLEALLESARGVLEELLDHYKVLVYCGQLDLTFPYPLMEENVLMNLDWSFGDRYRNAERKVWRLVSDKTQVAGYVRQGGNLFGAMVRNAGHLIAHDNPEYAHDLITRFINDIPYA